MSYKKSIVLKNEKDIISLYIYNKLEKIDIKDIIVLQ